MARRWAAGVLTFVALLLIRVSPAAALTDTYPKAGFVGTVGPTLNVYPKDGAWDSVFVTWNGIEGVDRYEVFYQNTGYQAGATWAAQVQGENTAGVPLKAIVADKTLSGHRAFYEVRAVGYDGSVIAAEGFEVVHSVYVALDKWSVLALADEIAKKLQDLFTVNAKSPGFVELENALSKAQNYGPMGQVKRAADSVGDLMAGVENGDTTAVSDLERDWFTFPLRLPDGSRYDFTLPVVTVLALDGWDKLWLLASAGLWVGFAVWLVTRLSPKTQA